MSLLEQEELIYRIMLGIAFTEELAKLYMSLTSEEVHYLHIQADKDVDRMPLVRE